jgi:putative flippase GtrA
MKANIVLQKIISFTTTLGQNAIPAGIFMFREDSAQTVMVLYFLETLIAVALAAAFVRLRAPAEDPAYAGISSTNTKIISNGRVSYRHQNGSRQTLIQSFLVFSFAFSLIPGIFMMVFVFLILRADISSTVIISGMTGIIVFQIINFVTNFFVSEGLTPSSAGDFLNQSMGRSILIFFSVFAGMIFAMFSRSWFLIPFSILKTIADILYSFKMNFKTPV